MKLKTNIQSAIVHTRTHIRNSRNMLDETAQMRFDRILNNMTRVLDRHENAEGILKRVNALAIGV